MDIPFVLCGCPDWIVHPEENHTMDPMAAACFLRVLWMVESLLPASDRLFYGSGLFRSPLDG